METEQKPRDPKEHRRRGRAFDTLAHVLRDVRELLFRNGFVMRNRPGENIGDSVDTVVADNVMEAYYEDEAPETVNVAIFGRSGRGEHLKTNLLSFNVNHKSASGTQFGYTNGVFRVTLSRDGEQPKRTGLYIMDRGAESDTAGSDNGETFAFVVSGDGYARLSFTETPDGHPFTDTKYDLIVSKNGIRMLGLPTSSAGLLPGALWNNAGTLSIV